MSDRVAVLLLVAITALFWVAAFTWPVEIWCAYGATLAVLYAWRGWVRRRDWPRARVL